MSFSQLKRQHYSCIVDDEDQSLRDREIDEALQQKKK